MDSIIAWPREVVVVPLRREFLPADRREWPRVAASGRETCYRCEREDARRPHPIPGGSTPGVHTRRHNVACGGSSAPPGRRVSHISAPPPPYAALTAEQGLPTLLGLPRRPGCRVRTSPAGLGHLCN